MIWLWLGFFWQAQAQEPFWTDLENFHSKSLSLKTERQNLESASDQLLSKRLFWTPTLAVSANQSEKRINGGDSTKTDYLEADAQLNLFRGGADWNSMKSAEAAKKAQELRVLNENLRVEIAASDLIFKSLYLTESHNIQLELLKLKEESLRIAKDRYSQGKLPAQEVTKSEVDLSQQRGKIRLAQQDLIENKTQIVAAFVSDIATKAWPFSEKLEPHFRGSERLPLAEEKFWLQQGQEQLWKAAKAAHWPSLDLVLQYQQFPIRERTDNQLLGTLQLTFPLWSRYETEAKASSAFAQFIAAENDFKDTDQKLKQKMIFLKEKIEIARQNLMEAKRNLELSKSLYQDVFKSFRLGRISTNDLLLEQNRLLDSQTNLALSQLAFHQTLIETCALAGLQARECLK
jgi:outer membrane protein TolC